MGIERTGNNAYILCTSATHPNSPSAGMAIYETDTNISYVWDGSVWQPLGQAARAWTFITEANLGSDGAISFTSIPQTFVHLMLLGSVRAAASSSGSDLLLRFNADTGTNYDNVDELVNSSGSVSGFANIGANGYTVLGWSLGASNTANRFSPVELMVPNYRSTAMEKDVIYAGGGSDASTTDRFQVSFGHWRNTAAITQIDLGFNSSGWTANFKASSRVTLLGMR